MYSGEYYDAPIHYGIKNNHPDIVRLLIENGANVNEKGKYDETPLHLAVMEDNCEIARYLLSKGADLNAEDYNCQAPLMRANSLKMVKLLLSAGANLKFVSTSGNTLLHTTKDREVTRFCLDNGMDVGMKNNEDLTPLHYAGKKNPDTVRLLIERGADVNAGRSVGWTPLLQAIVYAEDNYDVVQLLINSGADVSLKSSYRGYPLHFLAVKNYSKGLEESIKLCIEKGANLKVTAQQGYTPLHKAAKVASADVVKVLLDIGADPNCKNMNGETPIFFIEWKDGWRKAMFLISAGADLNVTDERGRTPRSDTIDFKLIKLLVSEGINVRIDDDYVKPLLFSYAGIQPNLNYLRGLISLGADVNILDDQGDTLLHYAADDEIADYLICEGLDVNAADNYGRTPLHTVHSEKAAKVLLEKGADINAKDREGLTPYQFSKKYRYNNKAAFLNEWIENHSGKKPGKKTVKKEESPNESPLSQLNRAIRNGELKRIKEILAKHHEIINLSITQSAGSEGDDYPIITAFKNNKQDIIRYLVKESADINIDGGSLLRTAVKENDREKIELLLELGMDINRGDDKKQSALFLAVKDRNAGMVDFLISKGAEINIQDKWGLSPLHHAAEQRIENMTAVLLKYKPDVNIETFQGETPLDKALFIGKSDVAILLVENGADVNTFNKCWGLTRLQGHANFGGFKAVKFLIENGADVNKRGKDGTTPLHVASSAAKMKLLLKNGADINARDNKGRTPIFTTQRVDILEYLESKGIKIQHRDNDDTTPLHLNAVTGKPYMVEYYLSRGFKPDEKDNRGRTALHYAAGGGKLSNYIQEIYDVLVDAGANVNEKDNDGATPLHLEILSKDYTTNALLQKGADINAQDNNGNTPLHYAIAKGYDYKAKLLISRGADINIKNKKGETPLTTALKNGRKEMETLLRSKGGVE